MELFDIARQHLAMLFHGRQQQGDQRVIWSGKSGALDAPAVVYFVHLVMDRKAEASATTRRDAAQSISVERFIG